MANQVTIQPTQTYCLACDLGLPFPYAHTCSCIKDKKATDVIGPASPHSPSRHHEFN